jgi:vanillate O-demethylase monooxygenase subunit
MFLKDFWYVACDVDEIGRAPLGRVLLGEPVVLYRQEDGAPVALEDRCCHRRMPLSKGRVQGDAIECGYHGLAFAPDGQCVRVPGQVRIPPGARVRSYPVCERHGWIWFWPGDPARADTARIPDFAQHASPGWTAVGSRFDMACDYKLVVENLLDLSHVGFVHRSTIGSDDTEARLKVERGPDWVRITRRTANIPVPKLYADQGLKSPVDQTKVMRFLAPSNVWIDLETKEAGPSGRAVRFTIVNAITPATETSCYYFFANTRDFSHDDAALSALLLNGTVTAFGEDKEVLEAQQRLIDLDPSAPTIDVDGDAGSLQMRRILDRLESEPAGPARAAE